MYFSSSTQRKHWLFTQAELEKKRRQAYEKITISKSVSLEEHKKYISYYGHKLVEAGIKLRFDRYYYNHALALYQRLYSANTAWDIQPQIAILVILFIVCKLKAPEPQRVESFLAALELSQEFEEEFKPAQSFPEYEIDILSRIKFELKVHLPFKEVFGFLSSSPHEEEHNQVDDMIKILLFSDALLLYPPGQIAFAAIVKTIGETEAQKLLPESYPPELMKWVREILELKDEQLPEERVKELDKIFATESVAIRTNKKAQSQSVDQPKTVLPP